MAPSTASERSTHDQETVEGLGTACHDIAGRTQAMLGGGGAAVAPRFELVADVPRAGVLAAIPALLANGLFAHIEKHFRTLRGYYPMLQIFLLLELMILARVKSVEKLRNQPCGEWGRMLGLDRIPEVRTLRRKLEALAQPEKVAAWSQAMGQFWMQLDPKLAGLLYIDGHVRAYHGEQTCLPERFSSRDRLRVCSLMDYWVNDGEGRPFFVVTALGTEGLLHHLRTSLVPRLLQEVPGQPSVEQLQADPRLHRFVIIFDREGWSPEFFAELWLKHRIAILTYRKGRYEPWEANVFATQKVDLPHGNRTDMDLAEKSCALPGEVPAREIRRLSEDRTHQTAIISTLQLEPMQTLAGHMFSRWSQENFFHYATQDLAIDHLPGHGLAPAPAETTVVNPAFRIGRQAVRRLRAEQSALEAERGRLALQEAAPGQVVAFVVRAASLDEKLRAIAASIKQQNARLKPLPRRIPVSALPEAQRPKQVAPSRHQFLNTLKICAYRAETAMVSVLREKLARSDDARALIKDLFTHPADLFPDPKQEILLVRLHHFTNPLSSLAVQHLLDHLNQSAALYPGTTLRLKFELVSAPLPRNQDA